MPRFPAAVSLMVSAEVVLNVIGPASVVVRVSAPVPLWTISEGALAPVLCLMSLTP